jgi:hypothetical protein
VARARWCTRLVKIVITTLAFARVSANIAVLPTFIEADRFFKLRHGRQARELVSCQVEISRWWIPVAHGEADGFRPARLPAGGDGCRPPPPQSRDMWRRDSTRATLGLLLVLSALGLLAAFAWHFPGARRPVIIRSHSLATKAEWPRTEHNRTA